MSRHEFMVRAALVAVLALLAAGGCGGGGVPAGTVGSPNASPLAPLGGPVPSQLAGAWQLVGDSTKNLKLSGSDYLFGDGATGNVAVNGSEIDFYNGEPCGIPLPGGIGRYRWSVDAGLLKLVNINSDPCARLSVLAEAKGWQRAPAPPGGPVSAELAGAWTQVADPSLGLDLSGTNFTIGHPGTPAHGNVAVNGSEIDFYDSDGCGIPLPGGIGSYRWTVVAGVLLFSPLNADPCSRGPYLADPKGWKRAP